MKARVTRFPGPRYRMRGTRARAGGKSILGRISALALITGAFVNCSTYGQVPQQVFSTLIDGDAAMRYCISSSTNDTETHEATFGYCRIGSRTAVTGQDLICIHSDSFLYRAMAGPMIAIMEKYRTIEGYYAFSCDYLKIIEFAMDIADTSDIHFGQNDSVFTMTVSVPDNAFAMRGLEVAFVPDSLAGMSVFYNSRAVEGAVIRNDFSFLDNTGSEVCRYLEMIQFRNGAYAPTDELLKYRLVGPGGQ